MAIIEHLWVDEKVTAFSGTGNITLPGTPYQTGSRTFAATYATGDTLIYVARDLTTGDEECGLNTVTITSGVAAITRTAAGVIESTNANGLVNFAGNDVRVFVDKAPGAETSANAVAGAPVVLNASKQVDSSLLPFPPAGIISGQWYGMPPGMPIASVGPDASYIDFILLDLQDVLYNYSAIGVNVTTAPSASTNLRLGIFSNVNGAPADLIFDAGTITITATGVNTLPLTGAPALGGKLWAAIGSPSQVNGLKIDGYNQYGNSILSKSLGANSLFSTTDNIVGYIQTFSTFGALPAATSGLMSRSGSAISAAGLQA